MSALFSNGEMVGGSVENTDFTSSDVADGQATSWTTVTPITNDEPNVSLFTKLSQIAKNVRYLYKMLGTTDVSAIGDGTVTGAINDLTEYVTTSSYTYTNTTSASCAASSYAEIYIDAPAPTGYVAVGIVGYYIHGGNSGLIPISFRYRNTQVAVRFANYKTSAVTIPQVDVTVVYKRNYGV